MRIALVGSNGHIGHALVNFLKRIDKMKIIEISRSTGEYLLELSNPESFEYSILDNVDYVIFTSCVVNQDRFAFEYEFCYKINVMGTVYFIKEALQRNCRVIFFSSDAVYGNEIGTIYDENSETNAVTAYGKMKKIVEDTFKEYSNFKTVRLSYVISNSDKFTLYLMKCIYNHTAADIYHPFYRNVITMNDVSKCIVWLLNHWDDFYSRALCISGYDLVSRLRIADELNRICEQRLRYNIYSISRSRFF